MENSFYLNFSRLINAFHNNKVIFLGESNAEISAHLGNKVTISYCFVTFPFLQLIYFMRSYSKHQLCVCALCMLWCEHNFSRWIGEITPHRTTTVLKSLMSTCANGASLQKRHRTHKIRTITNEQGVRHLLTTQKSCERWWWWWWRLVVGGCWSNRAINNIIIVPFHFLYHFKAIKYKCMISNHATFFLITCSM